MFGIDDAISAVAQMPAAIMNASSGLIRAKTDERESLAKESEMNKSPLQAKIEAEMGGTALEAAIKGAMAESVAGHHQPSSSSSGPSEEGHQRAAPSLSDWSKTRGGRSALSFLAKR